MKRIKPLWLHLHGDDVVHIVTTKPPPQLTIGRATALPIWDDLAVGPLLPPSVPLDAWTHARQAFWAGVEGGSTELVALSALEGLDASRPVLIWITPCVRDQIALLFAAWRLAEAHVPLTRVYAVQFPVDPDGRCLSSIAYAGPERLIHHPEPNALGMEEPVLASCWRALTADDSAALPNRITELPDSPLRSALACLAGRYPQAKSGVSVQDEKILRAVGSGDSFAWEAEARYVECTQYDRDALGSRAFWWRIQRLGDTQLTAPAVKLGRPGTGEHRFGAELHTRVSLTPFGERVLAGNEHFAARNGIDEWIGGYRLVRPQE